MEWVARWSGYWQENSSGVRTPFEVTQFPGVGFVAL
jgi:hypothetical protein